jgi:hypothetical protein
MGPVKRGFGEEGERDRMPYFSDNLMHALLDARWVLNQSHLLSVLDNLGVALHSC